MKKFVLFVSVFSCSFFMTSCGSKVAEEIKKDCSCGCSTCECPTGCSCECN